MNISKYICAMKAPSEKGQIEFHWMKSKLRFIEIQTILMKPTPRSVGADCR